MKIFYYMPYHKSLGADYWIYEGWKYAFIDLGHEFIEINNFSRDIKEYTKFGFPEILFIPNIGDVMINECDTLEWVRKNGTVVFMVVHWPMKEQEIKSIRSRDIADVYFSEREPESMGEFYNITGKKYFNIPQAANKNWHFPVESAKDYEYDILYLGARLPKKEAMFKSVLLPLKKKYKVGIFGPYWNNEDNFLRLVQKIFRKIKYEKWANKINEIRFKKYIFPKEIQNMLYSSSKICLNFHEREKDGSQPHLILTQRTFVIPACGGFEICDYVPPLRKYFSEEEMVMATMDKEDWFKKIEYYMNNEKERNTIRQKGTKRALSDHTYHNRVKTVIDIYTEVRNKMSEY